MTLRWTDHCVWCDDGGRPPPTLPWLRAIEVEGWWVESAVETRSDAGPACPSVAEETRSPAGETDSPCPGAIQLAFGCHIVVDEMPVVIPGPWLVSTAIGRTAMVRWAGGQRQHLLVQPLEPGLISPSPVVGGMNRVHIASLPVSVAEEAGMDYLPSLPGLA